MFIYLQPSKMFDLLSFIMIHSTSAPVTLQLHEAEVHEEGQNTVPKRKGSLGQDDSEESEESV